MNPNSLKNLKPGRGRPKGSKNRQGPTVRLWLTLPVGIGAIAKKRGKAWIAQAIEEKLERDNAQPAG